MKNFIQITALEYGDDSLEGFLELLARRFLDTYGQVERIELTGREVPFARRTEQSFQAVGGDYAVAELALGRDGTLEHRSRPRGASADEAHRQLLREASSGTSTRRSPTRATVRSSSTSTSTGATATSRSARTARRSGTRSRRPSPTFDSASIQELVHEMGVRVLAAFPEIDEISFDGQNRLWDTAQVDGRDERVRVYTDPRPPYGRIELTLGR